MIDLGLHGLSPGRWSRLTRSGGRKRRWRFLGEEVNGHVYSSASSKRIAPSGCFKIYHRLLMHCPESLLGCMIFSTYCTRFSRPHNSMKDILTVSASETRTTSRFSHKGTSRSKPTPERCQKKNQCPRVDGEKGYILLRSWNGEYKSEYCTFTWFHASNSLRFAPQRTLSI
jgi:hypothetical protein